MKKSLGLVIMMVLLFAFHTAFSHSYTTEDGKVMSDHKSSFTRESFKASLKGDRENFLRELKARKEEFRGTAIEKRSEFLGKARGVVEARFGAAISALEKAQERVGGLINKLETEGKDTHEAEEYLESSKEASGEAKEKLAEVKALLPADGSRITPEIFEKIKVGAREAKYLLKESRQALRESLKVIKELK